MSMRIDGFLRTPGLQRGGIRRDIPPIQTTPFRFRSRFGSLVNVIVFVTDTALALTRSGSLVRGNEL